MASQQVKLENLHAPRRRSLSKRGRFMAGSVLAGIVALALWYNQHRTIGWTDTFNPFYWNRRLRGDDLYDAEHAILLHGSHELPEVALTFDDGPHIQSCGKILDILKQYGAKATFFDVGQRMAEHPELVQRTLAEGHEIANHSTNHYSLPLLNPHERHREINDADMIYYGITGQHLTLLRPPGMRYNDTITAETKAMDYIVIHYTAASEDYNPAETAEQITRLSVRRSGNGSIILLHDYATTANALPSILEQLRAKGFRFVTISEMISHLPGHARAAVESFRNRDLTACAPPSDADKR